MQRTGRATIALDDGWKTLPDTSGDGLRELYDRRVPDTAASAIVPYVAVRLRSAGGCWFWRRFAIPAAWKGQTIRVRFDCGAPAASVWLNGAKLGEHGANRLPFEFNVTHVANIGADNLLAVFVSGIAGSAPELRRANVVAHDEGYISGIGASGNAAGDVSVDVGISNVGQNTGDGELDVRIGEDASVHRPLDQSTQIVVVTPGRNKASVLLTVPRKSVVPWSPANPHTYTVSVSFRQGADVLDTDSATVGLRTVAVTATGELVLNGMRLADGSVASSSLARVPASEFGAAAERELLSRARDAGARLLWLDLPDSEVAAMTDVIGLPIVESAGTGAAMEDVLALIARDRSHASVLAWDLGDAPQSLVAAARDADPARPLIYGPANHRMIVGTMPGDRPAPLAPGLEPKPAP